MYSKINLNIYRNYYIYRILSPKLTNADIVFYANLLKFLIYS